MSDRVSEVEHGLPKAEISSGGVHIPAGESSKRTWVSEVKASDTLPQMWTGRTHLRQLKWHEAALPLGEQFDW